MTIGLLVAGALALAVAIVALASRRRGVAEAERLAEERRRQALALHDNVVQGLARVTWALEASAYEHARAAADATLRDAQAMITGLLDEHPDGARFGPGSLRRAGGPPAPAPVAPRSGDMPRRERGARQGGQFDAGPSLHPGAHGEPARDRGRGVA